MSHRARLGLACLVLAVCGLLGCARFAGPEQAMRVQGDFASGSAAEGPQLYAAPAARAIIRNGSQRVEVETLDEARSALEEALTFFDASVEQERRTEGAAHLVVRVPNAALDRLMLRVAALGEEQSRSTTAQDVTGSLHDLEAELANQKALRVRMRELAKQAGSVRDLLQVERELARVQARVDQLEGQLARLRSQVAKSTLTIDLVERAEVVRSVPGPVQWLVRGGSWLLRKLWVIEY